MEMNEIESEHHPLNPVSGSNDFLDSTSENIFGRSKLSNRKSSINTQLTPSTGLAQPARKKSVLKRIWDSPYFQRPKALIASLFGSCGLFLVFSVILQILDVGSDCYSGITYIKDNDNDNDNHKLHGWLTIGIMFTPFVFTLAMKIAGYVKVPCKRAKEEEENSPEWSGVLKHLPFFQAFWNFRVFIGLVFMDTSNPHNGLLKAKLISMASEVSTTEAFLESGPQLMLQISIVLSSGQPEIKQVITIALSLASLIKGSFDQFFLGRVGKEIEEDPRWRFKFCIFPFVAISLLSSALIEFFMVLLFGVKGLIPIGFIVLINWALMSAMDYPSLISDNLDSLAGKQNAHYILKLKSEISKKVKLSICSSWISNSVVVDNSTKLQLVSSTIAISVYISSMIFLIQQEIFLPRTVLEDYSLVVCAPNNYSEVFEISHLAINETLLFFDTFPGLTINSTKIMRLCQGDESHLDFLQIFIVRTLVVAVLLKVFFDILLNIFADYNNLVGFLKLFGHQTFHHVTEIERKRYPPRRLPLELLQRNIDLLNKQDPSNGKTMMHTLALESYCFPWKSFLQLHQLGGRVDIPDFSNSTPMRFLSTKKKQDLDKNPMLEKHTCQRETLNNLIRNKSWKGFLFRTVFGAQPSAKNNLGKTSFDILVEDYLESNASVNVEDKDHQSFVNLFSSLPQEDFFLMLINLINAYGQSTSPEDKQKQLEKMILEIPEKVKTNQTNHRYFNPLEWFEIRIGDSAYRNETPLHVAARLGLHTILSNLLKIYPHPDGKSGSMTTPLHEVFEGINDRLEGDLRGANPPPQEDPRVNFKKCIQTLLDHQPNLDLKDKHGRTCLHLACKYTNSSPEIVELLLDAKSRCNVDSKDEEGMTALHYACKAGNTGCLRVLINCKRNATTSLTDNAGATPLHLACNHQQNSECAKLLLENDTNIDERDFKGMTPLHLACSAGNLDIVNILLSKKADPTLRTDSGKTPADLTESDEIKRRLSSTE